MVYFCKSRFRKRHPIMFRGRSGVETSLTAMSDGRATGEGSPTAHTRLDRQKQASTPATLGNTQFLPAKTGRDDAPHGAFDRPHNLTMMVPNCEN
ncbi:hypothetical protein QR685DRAFT_574544 [Neurospora intermedia]|uniref:Uncharacterized protein n=1 Tax=Neurospora intermedia TaxID=5142 RepID=A0ABR3D330_NEUIN